MHYYTAFHANLAFSSIPKSHYGWVIDLSYWPLLDLCESSAIPVGLEMTGHTLRLLCDLDPLFLKKMRELIDKSLLEPICGGEYQSIGPLMRPNDNLYNYSTGRDTFRSILQQDCQILYLPEQTVAKGLHPLIQESGFRAVILEWNNTARYGTGSIPKHIMFACPEWNHGIGGSLKILWNHSIIFQKVQRYVFGDISLTDVVDYLERMNPTGKGGVCLYGSDLEPFGYYPGRTVIRDSEYSNEHWQRLRDLFSCFRARHSFLLPSKALESFNVNEGVEIGSAISPILCKKQPKYNPVRWAVCGRGAAHLNQSCYQSSIAIDLLQNSDLIDGKKASCLRSLIAPCWMSDYRTFTEAYKWSEAQAQSSAAHSAIQEVKRELSRKFCLLPHQAVLVTAGGTPSAAVPYEFDVAFPPGKVKPGAQVICDGESLPVQWEDVEVFNDGSVRRARLVVLLQSKSREFRPLSFIGSSVDAVALETEFGVEITTRNVRLSLDTRRGLCARSITFPVADKQPLAGTIPHGFFDAIDWDADYYSGGVHLDDGHSIFHDLGRIQGAKAWAGPVRDVVETVMELGPVVQKKRYTVYHTLPRMELEQTFVTKGLFSAIFRAGIFTLLPESWDRNALTLITQNGGLGHERYPLNGTRVTHSEPIKTGVSSSSCLGATGGWVAFSDAKKTLTLSRDFQMDYSVPLIRYEEIGPHFFARIYHTLGERDDTSLFVFRGHQRVRFAATAAVGAMVVPGFPPHMLLGPGVDHDG